MPCGNYIDRRVLWDKCFINLKQSSDVTGGVVKCDRWEIMMMYVLIHSLTWKNVVPFITGWFVVQNAYNRYSVTATATWLFVQQLVLANNMENIKGMHYWPFVRGIHWQPVVSHTKDQWCGKWLYAVNHHVQGWCCPYFERNEGTYCN